jgi:hypothetical protein
MQNQWYLIGCVIMGAVQATEAWRIMRRSGWLAKENAYISLAEMAWLVMSFGVLLTQKSQTDRFIALLLIAYSTAITTWAARSGVYAKLIEQSEATGEFKIEQIRLSPAMTLVMLVFSALWAVAALVLL